MKTPQGLVVLAATCILGCGDPKSRSFFASGGICVGAPVMTGPGVYRLPMEFETEIVHSGQWIDTVKAEVDGGDIVVTAVFTHANRPSRYPGYVEIFNVTPGLYSLQYLDPDGSRHLIEPVTLPNSN